MFSEILRRLNPGIKRNAAAFLMADGSYAAQTVVAAAAACGQPQLGAETRRLRFSARLVEVSEAPAKSRVGLQNEVSVKTLYKDVVDWRAVVSFLRERRLQAARPLPGQF